MLPGQISPDGLWVWDGARWLSTTSPDGRWRWDGFRWAPLPAADVVDVAAPPARSSATLRTVLMAASMVVLMGAIAVSAIAVSGTRAHSASVSVAPRPLPTFTTVPGPIPSAPPLDASGYPGSPQGTQVYPVATRNHTTAHVDYAQTPPVGGLHAPVWLNCGIYDRPVPNENAVHSLEHGVVWVTYDPARVDTAGVAALRALVTSRYAGAERYVILSPYPGLPAPVVASAWGVQLRATSPSDTRVRDFIDYFRTGPQTPESGARCTGGVGLPVDGGGGGEPVSVLPNAAAGYVHL
jgi:hypothetical protein